MFLVSLKEGRERVCLSRLSQVCTTTSSSITTEDGRARRSWAPGLKATSCGTETRPEVGTTPTAPGPARSRAWATGTLAAVGKSTSDYTELFHSFTDHLSTLKHTQNSLANISAAIIRIQSKCYECPETFFSPL